MSSQVYRKYIDIINENSQPQVLDEGIMDSLKEKIVVVLNKILSPQEIEKMRVTAEKVLGKPSSEFKLSDLKGGNAERLAKALGATPDSVQTVKEIQTRNPGYEDDDGKSLYGPNVPLADKLVGQTGLWGGLAGVAASYFGIIPNWAIIPSLLAVMFLSQVGMRKVRY